MAITIDRTMRLPPGEFLPPTGTAKTGICIHHTVGGSAKSTVQWWLHDHTKQGKHLAVGTAYIIDRDGTIFEVFDPDAWAYQFGLAWPIARKLKFEQRFIGIEIASEGALKESNGTLYAFDLISPKTVKPRAEAFDYGKEYRGYRYFDRYEPEQVDSLIGLINDLCDRYHIARNVPDQYLDFYGDHLANFEGIIGHTMVRRDKTDPAPDLAFWKRVVAECRLKPVHIDPDATATGGRMTDQEIQELFEANARVIDQMKVAAGSMVATLLSELERDGRTTYIRLANPAPGGHTVDYTFVQGDRELVKRAARALGFKSVTDTTLEVAGGR